MKTNDAGIALIEEFEGCRLQAYPDPGTGAEPWTIGYGHTGGVKAGDKITKAQAEDLLKSDIAEFENRVAEAIDPVAATDNEFSAMVSLCFNIGYANFQNSSVLRAHKKGDKIAAANGFKLWNKAAGKVLPGLVRRRAAEAQLYLKPVTPTPAVETRTEPDPPPTMAKSPTVIGAAVAATAGVGQQVVENLPSIQTAHDAVQKIGGFDWVARGLGGLIVGAALFVLIRQWQRHQKGEQ